MTDRPTVIVIGAGGHARVVVEALGQEKVAGHLSPGRSGPDDGELGPWLGDDERIAELTDSGHRFAIGVGYVTRTGAARRSHLIERIDSYDLVTVCHVRSIVAPTARLGAGTYVGPAAVVGVNTEVLSAAIVNTGAIIDHDCVIGRNSHVAPGVTVSGGVTIGDDTLVGVAATVLQEVRIGSRSVIGAGAVVLEDVPDDVTAVGVPARVLY